jgi:hypothetical protein
MYECLYHRDGEFDAEYGDMSVEDKLDIMESFVRVTPMPIKSGEMVFLCNCGETYKNYACVHSGVLSGSGRRGAVEAVRDFIPQPPGCRQGTSLAPVAWHNCPAAKRGAPRA